MPRSTPVASFLSLALALVSALAATEEPQTPAALVAAADQLVAHPPELPEGSGSWVFYYANPKTGQRLTALSATEHKDPVSGEVFTDERTVSAYRGILHSRAEKAALVLARAYAEKRDDRYASGVHRILRKLADDYPGYPDRVDRWGHTGAAAPLGGRRYVQSLDEAVGIVSLTKAYDLTRKSPVYSTNDHRIIEENLFRGTEATLLRFNQGTSNHQTWYNAGLLAIARVLDDSGLAKKVLTMRGGVYDQFEHSVGADGLWYEGTMAYHFYALQALMETAELTRRMGWALENDPKFKRLFTAPLHAAYPDGSFPAIHDSDQRSIGSYDRFWRWAWETWRDPVFAKALARGNEKKLADLLGPKAKADWPLVQGSEVFADVGLVFLRRGEGARAVSVIIDFGPQGGEHGHYDKLNLMLFANNREWLLDPGRLSYSHKEYKTWVKTTAAHNTVTLDGRNQSAATGRLLYLEDQPEFVSAGVTCDTAYPDAVLTRHVLLAEDFFVDIFDVRAPHEVTMDLLAHAAADRVVPTSPLSGTAMTTAGERDGYPHFTDVERFEPRGDSSWDFVADLWILRAHLLAEPGEQILTARGIGYTLAQKTPTLIRRRQAAQTRFITVYDLSGHGAALKKVSRQGNDLILETSKEKFILSWNPQGRLIMSTKP